MRNQIIIGTLIVAASAGLIGLYMYNKKVPGLENVQADYSLSADELFDAFEQNEADALLKYENKVIAVTGKIASIKHGEVSSNVVLLAENALAGGINCSFSDLNKQLVTSELVTIKGRCQGFLMDVVLNNCTIDDKN